MVVEFLGMGATNDQTDLRSRTTGVFDRDYLRRIVRAHEDAGFEHLLFAYGSGSPDPITAATFAACHSETLQLRLAHRPNTSFPTVAAKQFLTLDHISAGRLTVHFITSGSQAEQAREGDYLSKDDRYRRTHEYIEVVRRAWESSEPFDHHGEFYDFEGHVSEIRPVNGVAPGVSFAGSSPAAWKSGAALADIYTLFGEPLADTAGQQRDALAEAERQGRTDPLRWQIAFRPIVAATDDLTWEKAHGILERLKQRAARQAIPGTQYRSTASGKPENAGSQRLLAAAQRGDVLDRALWTAPATVGWGAGSSTALVGSYETVAQAILDYVDLDFEIFGIRGYEDFIADATEFGQNVIPLVKQEVARREAQGWVGGARLAVEQGVVAREGDSAVGDPAVGDSAASGIGSSDSAAADPAVGDSALRDPGLGDPGLAASTSSAQNEVRGVRAKPSEFAR